MLRAMHALLLLVLMAQPPDVGRQCLLEVSSTPAPVRPPNVEYLGTFSRFRSTGDHAYGSEVTLLREGGRCVGYTRFSEGSLELDVALLQVESCPRQGTLGKISARYTQAFSLGSQQAGPQEISGSYTGTLERKGLVLSPGKVLPREDGTVDEAWEEYMKLRRLSECVQRRLGRLGQAERTVMEYPLNVYSRELADQTLRAICDTPQGPGAGLASVASSTEPGIRERALTLLERLSDRPGFGTCLIAFASRHASEAPARAFLGELVRTRPEAAAVYGQELETWARECVKNPGQSPSPCSGATAAVRALREDVGTRLETLLRELGP